MLANPGTEPRWVIPSPSARFSFAPPHFAPSGAEHAWPSHSIQVQLQLPLEDSLPPTQHLHSSCCGISARYVPRMEKSRWQHKGAGAAPCSLTWAPRAASSPLPTNLHRAQALAGSPPEGHSRRACGASPLARSRRTCRQQQELCTPPSQNFPSKTQH